MSAFTFNNDHAIAFLSASKSKRNTSTYLSRTVSFLFCVKNLSTKKHNSETSYVYFTLDA